MAAMLIMTFVSRMIYVGRMPQIRWNHPTASSIRNTVTAEGTVEVVNAQAIVGLEGLLVRRVCVAAGEQIEEDTVLYEVDTEDLQIQLDSLEAEERVWQAQVKTQKQEAATEIARAREDYDITVIELDRKIEEEKALLEDALEDLDTHLFRIPKEDAEDAVWIAWADERVRMDRVIEERRRALAEAELEKEKLLKRADRNIEDAKGEQNQVEGAYSSAYASIGQVQARENRLALWRQLMEDEGKVRAGQTGTLIEVMLQSGVRMNADAVMRYADAENSLIFRTILSQEQKAKVHTGDSVRLRFPGSSGEVEETIDSIVQEGGGYTVTIWLEPGVGQGCTEGVMEAVSTSEIYDYVIPKQALHDDGGTNYVYILEEKNGILGTELSVRSLTVRLLDRNDDKAAVMDELLGSDTKIVTDSDRELSNGMAVRLSDLVD